MVCPLGCTLKFALLIDLGITNLKDQLFIQKLRACPTTSWEIDGETVSDFIFLGSKITTDGDCSHEIKRRLLLGRKV